jgi:hypothetical protein
MSTVQMPLIHWFPSVGFRPAVIKERKDFIGHSGKYKYVFIAEDANIPYESKYDHPLIIPPFVSDEVPESSQSQLIPKSYFVSNPPVYNFWTGCCSSDEDFPPPPPPLVSLSDSLIFGLIGIAFLVWIKQICQKNSLGV